MKHFRLFIALMLMFGATCTNAQTARLYTAADGLANSHIYDIFQDSKGFIWFSTENGLSRFDGIKFSNFNFDRSRATSIASNTVRLVFEDSMGKFWIGTSAGLQTFDPEYSTFSKINLEDWSVPDSDQHITSATEVIHEGIRKIIVSTSGHGIYVLDAETHDIDHDTQNAITRMLPSKYVSRLFKDSRNRMWVTTEAGGVNIVDLNAMAEVEDIWSAGMAQEASDLVNSMAEDENTGNIYLGTSNHGILVWDSGTGRIRRSKGETKTGFGIMALLRNNIVTRYGENTWLTGLENHGIRLFDAENERISDIYISNVRNNTSDWKVQCLMEDSQGNVWVGATQTGVMIIPKSMFGFRHINLANDSGTSSRMSVTSVVADEDRECLWIGTDGGGIFSTDYNGHNFISYSAENSSISNNSIMSLVLDERGTLWVATYLGGLYTFTPERGFRQFREQKVIGSEKTFTMVYDKDDDVLYVGTHGNGFSKIDARNEKVLKKWDDDNNKWISYLSLDSSGLLWIGTYNGAKSYDSMSDRLTEYELIEGKSVRVNSILESRDGNMWIGTGEGLVCMDRATRSRKLYTENDGLACNSVSSILEDNDGKLWISTLNGLSCMDKNTDTFRNFHQHDGLQENEFNVRAAYRADNGRLYFGGINGLTAFYPQYVERREKTVPPLYLSRLSVMNEIVRYDPVKGSDNIIDKNISEATKITLPNDANLFSLEFSVLEYTNPKKIVYKYMLEGLDRTWNSTLPGSNSATYTNIPSGQYKFMVKAFYDGEPEEFSYREIDIKVPAPWYLSFWAWVVYISIGIAITLILIEHRNKKLALKTQEAESEIKEMKLQMFTNISHEIRTPLTLVMSPLKKMREDESDPKRKDLYNLMYRNSLRILRLVNQLLDMRKVDNGQMQLHFVETDIIYFTKDIMQSFDNLAVSKNISFTLECGHEAVDLWIDQGNFDKVIFNILSNAFKYTPEGGTVRISIRQAEENVEFVIENSGEKIAEKHLEKIFDRFYQTDVRDAKMGSGVGLHLAKMLVVLHHGEIQAYNTEEGVAFKIIIPSGNAHLSAEEITNSENNKDLYIRNSVLQEERSSAEDILYNSSDGPEEETKHNKTRKSIILVDDDSEMRAYLKQELQAIYNVEVYSNGKDAWARISTGIPDAVITDLIMDKMDGAYLCEKIKKNLGTNHIPVIILTSSTDEHSQQRCIESGADRFFTKPISLEILKSAVAGAIATRETIRNKFSREVDYGYGDMKMVNTNNELINKVISTIRKNIENSDFSVEELSREVGMSRVHLNRKLKETMNISPSNLIRSIRLKQAAYLLINNKVNISEVAYKVGFSTHSYFSNSFHDYFGMTPKEFTAQYMNCTDEETLKKLFG